MSTAAAAAAAARTSFCGDLFIIVLDVRLGGRCRNG